MIKKAPKLIQRMYQEAKKIQKNAYCPYSKYPVACTLLASDGKFYSGVNVENCVNGASICAEYSAIGAMISAGQRQVKEILVVTNSKNPAAPCGKCRQFLSEFASEDTLIHATTRSGRWVTYFFSEVFPFSFENRFILESRKASR